MTAKIVSVRPKRLDVLTEALQLVLDFADLRQESKDDLANALGRVAPQEGWPFVMLNPDQLRYVLKTINGGPRPSATLSVWNAAISYIRYDTGEIMAGREALSEAAGVNIQEVSRALVRLAEIGALLRLKPGRYAINPHVGWQGSLVKRQKAATDQPSLHLVK